MQLLTVRIRLTARIPGDKCFIADEYMSIRLDRDGTGVYLDESSPSLRLFNFIRSWC